MNLENPVVNLLRRNKRKLVVLLGIVVCVIVLSMKVMIL